MIDLHSHVIPEKIIVAMSRRSRALWHRASRSKEANAFSCAASCASELVPEFSVAQAKLETMDRKGIEISVISPGPQVFFYDLKEAARRSKRRAW